ncbi:MAG: SMP-30/gluconolactonase/LRE family protein [Dehalococcoidia bacterium]|nr:SMP-30/gluconolactonase/LRE family protein [Dehalococcoidia bacterium]
MDGDLSGILESPKVTQVVKDMVFTEGPVWHSGGYLTFVDIRRSLLLKWTPGKGVETIREKTNEGNGCTLDQQGRLMMCEGGNRRIGRLEKDGAWTVVVDKWRGKRFNKPNDIVRRSDDSFYFTDPGLRVPKQDRDLDAFHVWRIFPDGTVDIATDQCPYPNGLGFSPDGKTLYVANSRLDERCDREMEKREVCEHRYVHAFDVNPDGKLTNRRVFATMYSNEQGVPDGMKVDRAGNVFVTGSGGTWVFDKTGKKLGVIRTPEVPANCAFGGPDFKTLYFTAHTSIYAMSVKTPGIGAF